MHERLVGIFNDAVIADWDVEAEIGEGLELSPLKATEPNDDTFFVDSIFRGFDDVGGISRGRDQDQNFVGSKTLESELIGKYLVKGNVIPDRSEHRDIAGKRYCLEIWPAHALCAFSKITLQVLGNRSRSPIARDEDPSPIGPGSL